jgi:hypothetical protein
MKLTRVDGRVVLVNEIGRSSTLYTTSKPHWRMFVMSYESDAQKCPRCTNNQALTKSNLSDTCKRISCSFCATRIYKERATEDSESIYGCNVPLGSEDNYDNMYTF